MANPQGALGGAYNPLTDYTRTGATDTGGTYAGATLTSPTLSGTTAIGAGTTITTPTITTPAITGGTITGATISGSLGSDNKVLAAGITYTSNVTPAVITGFSWTVVAGTYIFEMNLPTVMTTVGGLTVSLVLTTAVLTSIQYQTYAATAVDNSTAVSTTGTTATSTTKVFDSKTSAYTYVRVWGSMVVGTGGTFAWHGCQNTSAGAGDVTSLALGAYAKMQRVA